MEGYHVGLYKKFWDIRASIQVCKERVKVLQYVVQMDIIM